MGEASPCLLSANEIVNSHLNHFLQTLLFQNCIVFLKIIHIIGHIFSWSYFAVIQILIPRTSLVN